MKNIWLSCPTIFQHIENYVSQAAMPWIVTPGPAYFRQNWLKVFHKTMTASGGPSNQHFTEKTFQNSAVICDSSRLESKLPFWIEIVGLLFVFYFGLCVVSFEIWEAVMIVSVTSWVVRWMWDPGNTKVCKTYRSSEELASGMHFEIRELAQPEAQNWGSPCQQKQDTFPT